MAGPDDTIQDIFSKSTLTVPEYQRGYSWDERNIEDLIDDLQYLLGEDLDSSNETEHYFGTIILERTESGSANIVDGQQRLITTTLLMKSILQSQHISLTDEKWQSHQERYVGTRNEPAIDTNQQGEKLFERLIFGGVDPQNLTGQLPAERNLLTAKAELEEWISELPKQYDEPAEEVMSQLTQIIENRLTVTIHWVEDSSEAGRIFETINDRGKDLTIADKIKSYLIFVADRENEPELGTDVFTTFGEIVKQISAASTRNSQSKIESFLKEHWRLFTGEALFERQNQYRYTEVHRKLKKQEQYAALSRDTDELKSWIQTYLKSLRECVESYCVYLNAEQKLDTGNRHAREGIIEYLQKLELIMQSSNVAALFISAHQRFGVSDRLVHLLNLLETFTFRAYEVCRANRDARRTEFRRVAYRLYYAGRREEADKVSKAGQKEPYVNLRSGFRSACYEIENAIGAYGTERSFERNLSRRDIIDGSLNDDGWNGFRNKDSILYLLIEYNDHLGGQNRPQFDLTDIEQGHIDLEHIWPRDPDMVDPRNTFEHRQYRDALGNLGFLLTETGEKTDNKSYEEKYRRFYSLSNSPALMQDLPDPSDGPWGTNQIQKRGKEMVEFATSRWRVETQAHVHIIETDETDLEDIKDDVRIRVREDFDGNREGIPSEFNNIPYIEVTQNTPEKRADLNIGCPACGSTSMTVIKDEKTNDDAGTELRYICKCGEELTQPSVSFYFADHI